MSNKEELLRKLQKELENCKGCNLEGKGYPVFSGDVNQEIMVIGYKPTEEDIDLLSHEKTMAIITQILSKLEDVKEWGAYVTYLLRCFVPDEYYTDEIKEICREYLKKEIEIVSPLYVVLVGNNVINELVGDKKFFGEEGKVLGHKCKIYTVI